MSTSIDPTREKGTTRVKTGFAEMMKGGVFIRAPRFKGLAAAVEVLSATPQGECAKAVFWRSPSTPN